MKIKIMTMKKYLKNIYITKSLYIYFIRTSLNSPEDVLIVQSVINNVSPLTIIYFDLRFWQIPLYYIYMYEKCIKNRR